MIMVKYICKGESALSCVSSYALKSVETKHLKVNR